MGLARLMGFNFSADEWRAEYQELCRRSARGVSRAVVECGPEKGGPVGESFWIWGETCG